MIIRLEDKKHRKNNTINYWKTINLNNDIIEWEQFFNNDDIYDKIRFKFTFETTMLNPDFKVKIPVYTA